MASIPRYDQLTVIIILDKSIHPSIQFLVNNQSPDGICYKFSTHSQDWFHHGGYCLPILQQCSLKTEANLAKITACIICHLGQ